MEPWSEEGMTTEPYVSVFIPIETKSEANLREHWGEHARRAKRQRDAAMVIVRCALARNPAGAGMKKTETKLKVTLVRSSARPLESDNLARALKAIRDGVAEGLGRDDDDKKSDAKIAWEYDQVANCGRDHGVAVTIEVRQ
jgi:hypothetical protein